ncbi:hypothetical protein P6H86_14215 [Escherichia coli]|nr:hypothetical protein [Escherichia coli]WFM64856.1 hypothetical protein P6H86_14215 [Escherichia coli]
MSEVTDLVVIEKANAMTVFQSADQIEEILQCHERCNSDPHPTPEIRSRG